MYCVVVLDLLLICLLLFSIDKGQDFPYSFFLAHTHTHAHTPGECGLCPDRESCDLSSASTWRPSSEDRPITYSLIFLTKTPRMNVCVCVCVCLSGLLVFYGVEVIDIMSHVRRNYSTIGFCQIPLRIYIHKPISLLALFHCHVHLNENALGLHLWLCSSTSQPLTLISKT